VWAKLTIMSTESLQLQLPENVRTLLEEQVAQGGYQDASEYVSALILEAQRDQEAAVAELERLREEGLEGPREVVTPEYWDKIRREVEERARARQKP
jgi:antitoxin ParD1/3/4